MMLSSIYEVNFGPNVYEVNSGPNAYTVVMK